MDSKTKVLLTLFFIGFNFQLFAQIRQITDASGTSNGIPYYSYSKVGLIGDKLLFPGGGGDLYITDGTPEGTASLKDEKGHAVQRIFTTEMLNNQMIIAGYNSEDRIGPTLYRTDGTQAGTIRLTGVYMQSINCIETIGDKAYMTASAPFDGLWITDGTPEGTEYLTDKNGDMIDFPCGFDEYNGQVYFSGVHPSLGQEMYKTDGTVIGTELVKDINPGSAGATGSGRFVFKDLLWFKANHPNYGYELWTSDGTAEGTQLFADLWSGTSSASPSVFYLDDEYMYLHMNSSAYGRELWRSDGTIAGTQLFADINEGSENSAPYFLKAFKDGFITYAKDATTGYEFRLIDKSGNVSLIKDINEGTGSPFTYNYRQHQDLGFFEANDGIHGKELWRTDGTSEGTYMIIDMNEGEGSSNPEVLQFTDNGFYFSAETDEKGRELYFMEVPEFSSTPCDGEDVIVNGNEGTGTIAADEYWATNTLTSSGVVEANSSVTFKAGESIRLENGFHAENGSIVEISIAECEEAAVSAEQQLATARTQNNASINALNLSNLTLSPNPSKTQTQIVFTLEKEEHISLIIRSQTGQIIRQFHETNLLSKGTHQIDFYHENISAGMYLVELQTEKERISKKLIVLK